MPLASVSSASRAAIVAALLLLPVGVSATADDAPAPAAATGVRQLTGRRRQTFHDVFTTRGMEWAISENQLR